MNKVRERALAFRAFMGSVSAEMKKCSWPDREELLSSTLVVIVSVCMISLYVGICDQLLATVLKLLVPGR